MIMKSCFLADWIGEFVQSRSWSSNCLFMYLYFTIKW